MCFSSNLHVTGFSSCRITTMIHSYLVCVWLCVCVTYLNWIGVKLWKYAGDMCIDVNLPWTIWRFLLSHPSEPNGCVPAKRTKWRFLVSRLSEPKGDSWGLAIVNPIFQRRFPVSRFFIRPALPDVCVCVKQLYGCKTSMSHLAILVVSPPVNLASMNQIPIPHVSPSWTQHICRGTYTLSNEALHQRGKHPLAIDVYRLVYIMTRFVYMSKAPVVYIFTLLVYVPKTPVIYN